LSAFAAAGTAAAAGEKLIPVVVTGKVEPAVVQRGAPIPLAVTIANGFKGPVTYSAFSLRPNDWNGETARLTLVDVYRDGNPQGLFAGRPRVKVPARVAGVGAHPIGAGRRLTVRADARKWKIVGGWVPGKYKVTVRVENLAVDGDRCILSVQSEPFTFEVR
jgi:hypothetical protein